MHVSINKPFTIFSKLLRRSLSDLLRQSLKTLISVVSTANVTLQRQQVAASYKLSGPQTNYICKTFHISQKTHRFSTTNIN
jgi:transcriptional regulator CtsR